ncbi:MULTISPECIES: flagellar hook-length control protein FliK [Paenibacillus]|uniref:flagellar hook-length control protein FliK n=1 Tax=Paenibacillus TaxID=44249 RepID=UPI0022B89C35|nr:flagellar hook-length control protein FliK [Paenibacillus caseinilyticus]MCZ8520052.1 flagellar hook-length control protein FliK [Paenibacillus caseinilyticus]
MEIGASATTSRNLLQVGTPVSSSSVKSAGRERDGFSTALKEKLGEPSKAVKEATKDTTASADATVKTSSAEAAQASSKTPADEEKLEALEEFMQEGDPAEVNALLADPGVQALLQQLSELLKAGQADAGTTDAAAEAVDAAGALFVPLAEAAAGGMQAAITPAASEAVPAAIDAAALQTVDAAEAVQILQGLQKALKEDGQPKLKAALEELGAAVSKAAESQTASKPAAQIGQLLQKLNGEAAVTSDVKAQSSDTASGPLQKLETLAVKHGAPPAAMTAAADEGAPAAEEPLFVPLNAEAAPVDATAQPAVTVPDLLKQIQSGQAVSKMPTLHMPAETFTDDMTQFVAGSFLLDSGDGGITEAKLSLYPQHLGHVEVKLTMHNGQLIAQFAADSATGKDMLESQLAQLKHSLQSQGIQVEKLEVTQSANAQGFQSGMFQEKGQGQQPQSKQNQKAASARIAALGEEAFGEEATQTSARPARAGSGMIDVIA